MDWRFYTIILTLLASIICSCTSNSQKNEIAHNSNNNSSVQYAKDFTVEHEDQPIKNLIIKNRWSGKLKEDKYTLVPRDCTGCLANNLYAIPYPLKSVVCMSSSHVAYLTALGESHIIKGISGTRFIYNKHIQKLVESGEIEDIGAETLPDYERILYMKPDVVIAYGIDGGNNSYIEKLQKLGIRVLTIGDYLENSPLGKMEYLKLFGELTGKRTIADSLFRSKADEYILLKEKISESLKATKPTSVILNAPYKGIWYIPGNENYTSQLIRDAGGVVVGAKENEIQSAQLGFEQAYAYALQADVWLHPNAINTLTGLSNENKLFKNIPALKSGRVYNNTLRNTPEGGSDFWETGVIEPHIILQDLAGILHPELFENPTELNYYIKLE